MKIGTKLKITDVETVFFGGIVAVSDVQDDLLVCQVVKQPDTEAFKKYKGIQFSLSSFVYVRTGQYVILKGKA